jgi:hypothetical protein
MTEGKVGEDAKILERVADPETEDHHRPAANGLGAILQCRGAVNSLAPRRCAQAPAVSRNRSAPTRARLLDSRAALTQF